MYLYIWMLNYIKTYQNMYEPHVYTTKNAKPQNDIDLVSTLLNFGIQVYRLCLVVRNKLSNGYWLLQC